jgi:hypothetical protein
MRNRLPHLDRMLSNSESSTLNSFRRTGILRLEPKSSPDAILMSDFSKLRNVNFLLFVTWFCWSNRNGYFSIYIVFIIYVMLFCLIRNVTQKIFRRISQVI